MMNEYLHSALRALETTKPMLAIPLLVIGALVMMFGWRMWRFCVPAALAALGYLIAERFVTGDEAAMIHLAAAAGMGLLGWCVTKHATTLLGGLAGAALLAQVINDAGLHGLALLVPAAMGLLIGGALARINLQMVVIILTAIEGAALFMSGLLIIAMRVPALYGAIRETTHHAAFMLPFLALVPTVVSCFYQMADARRTGSHFSEPGVAPRQPIKAGGI